MRYLTAKEMAKVDKLAMRTYHLPVEQMMENAGRNVADFISKLKPKRVSILYGKGNNGGDGLVTARHLHIRGIKVDIIPASKELHSTTKNQLAILRKMGIRPKKKLGKADVVVDSLLGYNIRGNPRGKFAELIKDANSSKAKIVSFDIPSGMDPDTGFCYDPCIQADYILTLALPKVGLRNWKKKVHLVNIGIPNELYSKHFKSKVDPFRKGDVVKI